MRVEELFICLREEGSAWRRRRGKACRSSPPLCRGAGRLKPTPAAPKAMPLCCLCYGLLLGRLKPTRTTSHCFSTPHTPTASPPSPWCLLNTAAPSLFSRENAPFAWAYSRHETRGERLVGGEDGMTISREKPPRHGGRKQFSPAATADIPALSPYVIHRAGRPATGDVAGRARLS